MIPNLFSPHPFNAPLLPLLRFRASSLSSPRREIGLMKLKGMGLSQHCGFQWHCLIHPPLLSVPSTPTPNQFSAHPHYGTIYNTPTKDPYLTYYIRAYYRLFDSTRLRANTEEGGKKWLADQLAYIACICHFKVSINASNKTDQKQRSRLI